MSIVIQHVETRQFVADDDAWVADPHDALTFSDTRHALKYCRNHSMQGVRVVVFFKDRKVSLLLYIPGSNTPAPAGQINNAANVAA